MISAESCKFHQRNDTKNIEKSIGIVKFIELQVIGDK